MIPNLQTKKTAFSPGVTKEKKLWKGFKKNEEKIST